MTHPPTHPAEDPVRIIGVIAEEVGVPRSDGTSMSTFYRVPLKLSHPVTLKWETVFERMWNHSPRFAALRRASIARVDRDKIILSCTTLEEVLHDHKQTLIECVQETNRVVRTQESELRQREEEYARLRTDQRKRVDEMKDRLKF